jgi:hypothetical protein
MMAHVIGIGRSANEYDRQVLSVSTAYAIEGREGANTVGHDADTNSMATGVAFGGKGTVEFIGAPNLCQGWMRFKFIEKNKVIISWNNEVMMNIELGNPLCEIVTHSEGRHGVRGLRYSPESIADSKCAFILIELCLIKRQY